MSSDSTQFQGAQKKVAFLWACMKKKKSNLQAPDMSEHWNLLAIFAKYTGFINKTVKRNGLKTSALNLVSSVKRTIKNLEEN